jgi:hypothetical protein
LLQLSLLPSWLLFRALLASPFVVAYTRRSERRMTASVDGGEEVRCGQDQVLFDADWNISVVVRVVVSRGFDLGAVGG